MKNKMNISKLHEVMQLMIEEGVLVPTGEMRPDSNGKLHPVYALSEEGRIKYAGRLLKLPGTTKGSA